MAHHVEDTAHLSPQELQFRDFIKRGDDFSKIEIFKLAVEEYAKALAMNIDNHLVEEKLAYCKTKMTFEKKVFVILGIIVVVIVAAVYLFK